MGHLQIQKPQVSAELHGAGPGAPGSGWGTRAGADWSRHFVVREWVAWRRSKATNLPFASRRVGHPKVEVKVEVPTSAKGGQTWGTRHPKVEVKVKVKVEVKVKVKVKIPRFVLVLREMEKRRCPVV